MKVLWSWKAQDDKGLRWYYRLVEDVGIPPRIERHRSALGKGVWKRYGTAHVALQMARLIKNAPYEAARR